MPIFILKLLPFITTWKRLFIFIVLSASVVTGYSLYENRQQIAYYMMSSVGMPQINSMAVNDQSNRLLLDVNGSAMVVWKINLAKNQRTALYVKIKGHREEGLEGTGALVLQPYSRLVSAMIELLDNKASCFTTHGENIVDKQMVAFGITYFCAAAIPPEYGQMIGMLVVGFMHKPDNEYYVKLRLKQAAEQIIK